jgi:hypothetical protein
VNLRFGAIDMLDDAAMMDFSPEFSCGNNALFNLAPLFHNQLYHVNI